MNALKHGAEPARTACLDESEIEQRASRTPRAPDFREAGANLSAKHVPRCHQQACIERCDAVEVAALHAIGVHHANR